MCSSSGLPHGPTHHVPALGQDVLVMLSSYRESAPGRETDEEHRTFPDYSRRRLDNIQVGDMIGGRRQVAEMARNGQGHLMFRSGHSPTSEAHFCPCSPTCGILLKCVLQTLRTSSISVPLC